MATIDSSSELAQLIDTWEKESASGADPVPTLTKLAVLVEKETEAYLKKDPDPFDDRHPSRAHPDCTLGHILKSLFKHEAFINKLLNNYVMSRDNRELNVIACRLLLDILPGLETTVVFQDTEGLMQRLFSWAESAPNPLQSYATGLLAASMEVQDIATNFREKNSFLVPLMLKRLHELSREYFRDDQQTCAPVNDRPFAHLNKESDSPVKVCDDFKTPERVSENRRNKRFVSFLFQRSASMSPARATSPFSSGIGSSSSLNECSNSSWAELEPLMIGCHQMYPLTLPMQQRFILQYLTPMGEYQELLSYVFEHSALSLILRYVNLKENADVRLAFEALKYLASLLCHKKFAIEFINVGGLQHLLQVHRPSVAATGVSICLYYLAYSEDAMERVCLLPTQVLSDLVRYALWLLECSHDSSRCHATMFFGLTFAFGVIQKLFDEQDGLRKLFNVMSTLDIFVSESNNSSLSDDQVFASRQAARHVCCALKRYYEAHLASKAEDLRRSHSRNQGSSPQPFVPPYKAARYSNEAVQENIETLLELMPLRMHWKPVDELQKLDGVSLLLRLIGMSYEWNYSGSMLNRAETVRSALDVLNVCSVTPKTQLALCESISVVESHNTVGISIVLAAAEGDLLPDADVQRSALNVIINCVCGPMSRVSEASSSSGRSVTGTITKKKAAMRSGEDLLSKMWKCVRANNGIMILLNLLTVKTPITDADSIRSSACKALCGLARCETVKQIISKLPLCTSGQLQVLMREPVLQDKRQDHVKFCKHCIRLIEMVTGAPVTTGIESSLCKINKAEVVAQTKIMYHEKQLLQLMYQHLIKKGLSETASVLQKEAILPAATLKPSTHIPPWASSPCTPKMARSTPLSTNSCNTYTPSTVSASPSIQERLSSSPVSLASPNTLTPAPIRVTLTASRNSMHQPSKVNKTPSLQKPPTCSGNYSQTPVMKRQATGRQTAVPYLNYPPNSAINLDSIITEYLRKQHALCKNPVVTCPPFDLFVPHQCPEPQYKSSAPVNMTARLHKRQIHPQYGGYDGARMNRRFIYSRFRPVRTYRDSEGSSSFTCCAFSSCEQFLLLGTFSGDLKAYNMHSGTEEATYQCHDSEVTHCEASRDSKLLLTSSAWRRPLSALWNFSDRFEMKHNFEEDYYVEFGKLSQDRIIGTKYETAHIYDTSSGQLIQTLCDLELGNNYTKNRATFDPTDELVLSDGVIWDVRSGKPIHKLDKFNPNINGVFHPNGLEIISNSEIWDLRTFHLLHTVPALDQCQITFNQTGDVIYGAMLEEEVEMDEDQLKSPYGSSFRTFDAIDYSSIATIDIKKNIFDLATDKSDCYLAIVENQVARDGLSSTESICRLYEVGRCREDDDEEGDDEEESEEMEDESEDDDDDDDDDDDEGDNEDGEQENDNDNDDDGEREPMSISDDDDDDSDEDNMLFAINTF